MDIEPVDIEPVDSASSSSLQTDTEAVLSEWDWPTVLVETEFVDPCKYGLCL